MSRSSRSLLILVLLWKAWIVVAIEVCRSVTFGWFNAAVWNRNFHFWPDAPRPTSEVMYATWDAQHYLYLATHGYRDAEISMVFPPGWPAVLSLAGSDPWRATLFAVVIANMFSLGALWLLHRLVARRHSVDVADLTIAMLIAFPTAFFLSLPYSEALFLLLSVACLDAIDRERFVLAAALALLATTVRMLGICLVVPLAYTIAEQRRWSRFVLVPLPVLAIGVHRWVVDHFALRHELLPQYQQQFVAHPSPWHLVDLPRLFELYAKPLHWHGVMDSAIDRALFPLTIALAFATLRRKETRGWALYCLALIWTAATTASLISFSRYALAAAPLFALLAQRAVPGRVVKILYFLVALPLQLVFLLRHIHNYWVG